MTDNTEDNLIEVRTFATMQEIESLLGFKEDNPINKDNYERIFGDYWFPDEVTCCREKTNGQLCGEGHKWGFVAKLKDGSITIIGNYCARDKFGADAKIKADRSKYLNEKRRRERLAQLEDLLADKEKVLKKLVLLKEELEKIQDRVNNFSDSLGGRTLRRLQDIARTGSTTVFVDVITYREYLDEDGEKQIERRVAPARVGTLNGVSIFNEYSFQSIKSTMRAVKMAYEEAGSISGDIKTSQLESLTSSMADFDRVDSEAKKIQQEETSFFANDLGLLCFLVDDKSERYKTAQLVLEHSGESVGKDKAKNWLIEKEKEMKNVLKADKIGIQY
jgi:hypothetical protein